jgi:hypothetical protein
MFILRRHCHAYHAAALDLQQTDNMQKFPMLSNK